MSIISSNDGQTPNRRTKTRMLSDAARHCFDDTKDVCTRSWMCVSRTSVSAWNWLYNNVFNSPCCTVDDDGNVARTKKVSIRGNVKQKDRNQRTSPPTKLYKYQQPPRRSGISGTRDMTSSSKTATPTPSQTVTSSPSTIDSDQQVTQNVKQSSVPSDQQRLSSGPSQIQEKRSDDKNKPPKVSPPKIDFVETGSIFGDRKRHTQQPLLLLDNGRFKSPGKPNVTQGPGGRTIRISFQTGLVSIKSIESRAQVMDKFDSKEMLDAESTTDNTVDSDNLDQVSKIKMNRKKKKGRTKKRISKASKTFKSSISRDSKESEPPGPELDDSTNRTLEGDENSKAGLEEQ